MKKYFLIKWIGVLGSVALLMTSCQKMERPALGDFPKDPPNPGGTLRFYAAMDGSGLDSMRLNMPSTETVTFQPGIRGQAMKGAAGKYILYPSSNDVNKLGSFTVAMWINTQKHTDGAEAVFTLPRTDDFWGNMFMLIEGNGSPTDNSMQIKFHFDGQWRDFNGAQRWPDMYGGWRHVAFTYDAATSTFAAYRNGVALTLPANFTEVKNGADPFGKVTFQSASKFIIGGFNQHAGYPNANIDGWMQNYRGLLDQFRIYSKALSAAEVSDLYANTK